MSLVQKVNKLREQIQQIQEELVWLDTAPLDPTDLKARMVQWVDGMAQSIRGKELDRSLAGFRDPDSNACYLDILGAQGQVSVPAVPHVDTVNSSIAPQLAWLFGDQIKQALLAKVDAMDYVPGLPLAERPQRRKQLRQELRVLEEKEEALICESEEANAPIYRRADADPAVVLNYIPDSGAVLADA